MENEQTRIEPRWMMRNSRGEKDGMWTLLVISFIATTMAYMLSILEVVEVGGTMVSFRPFDGLGYAAIVLVPLISGYFGRRYTTAQNETAMAKAKIYSEVAKRKLETNRPRGEGGIVIDPSNVANRIHDQAELELKSELDEPQDEI